MKRLYTLRDRKPGECGEVLNGKIFFVHMDDDKRLHFLDAQDNMKPLWVTSELKSLRYTNTGVVMRTANRSAYYLTDLSKIIPTAIEDRPTEEIVKEETEKETETTESIHLIYEEQGPTKEINYCDGYEISYAAFEKPVTKAQLQIWLASQGRVYKLKADVPWYEDFVELDPMYSDLTKWKIKRIRRYTD